MNMLENRLAALYKISTTLHQLKLNTRNIAQTIVTMTGEAIGAEFGCLITFHDDYKIDCVYLQDASSKAKISADLWNVLLTRGLVGFARHRQRTVLIRDITTDPRWPILPENAVLPRTGCAVGLPLYHNSHVHAVLMFTHSKVDFFDQPAIDFLEEVARVASAALGNALDFSAVRSGTAHYQALFEDAIVPIILTDRHGLIVDANQRACDFLGNERGSLIRQPITTIHPMEDITVKERFHGLAMGEEIGFRTTARNDQGVEVPVTLRARRLMLGDRDVIEWVEQDVTAQMELEQLRRDLSAMVYHDLRGPLQTIKGSISKLGQLLANHEHPAVWTLLQIGIRSTRQLQRMVDSLLDVQRLEEGKAVLNRSAVELRVLLGDAAQLVQPLAAEASHRIEFDLTNELPLVMLDNDMIMRVVINLMENAIKYTPDGETITLKASIQDDKMRISVRDSGPGIPPEMKRQVFDKFSRIKYKDAPKGVGLGLAFCRLAVEAHGGTIWVESEPGEGSEFIFTLPLIRSDGDDSKAATSTEAKSALATA